MRTGNFTSSEIQALIPMGTRPMTEEELKQQKIDSPSCKKKTVECWPGTAALTYIEECNIERKLCRSITKEENAKPLLWGKLLELRAFNLLGVDYTLCSKDVLRHPEFDYWAGSPDGYRMGVEKTVTDIKCPISLKSYCTFYDCTTIEEVREKHKDGEKYYWQLVSNSILANTTFAELIFYMPYKSELPDIRQMIDDLDVNPNKYAWLNWSEDEELPYLIDGAYYKNIRSLSWRVSEADKQLLTDRVREGGKYLIKQLSVKQSK